MTIGVRCHDSLLGEIDQWRASQPDQPTRATAIRSLAEIGLSKSTKKPRPTSPERASKASKLAGERIDHLGDKSATEDDRQQRKRRLLKGPEELRDMRVDQPKPK